MTAKKGKLSIIRRYFGKKDGQTLSEFASEVTELSDAEKLELAQGAALNLGLSQQEVDFPMNS